MIASKKRRNLVKEDKQTNIAAAMQVLQILVLAIGLAGVFVRLGENQANLVNNINELSELGAIVQDLVKSQVEYVSNDVRLEERMNALRLRIDRLERTF